MIVSLDIFEETFKLLDFPDNMPAIGKGFNYIRVKHAYFSRMWVYRGSTV